MTILCPSCSKPLFHLQPQAPGVNAIRRGDPLHEHDALGDFVTCPHCSKRVDLDVTSVPGGGAKVTVRR